MPAGIKLVQIKHDFDCFQEFGVFNVFLIGTDDSLG